MALLNWSSALSAAGGAAAAMGLEGVRASLEERRIELANRLASERQISAEQRAPALAAATTTATADATAAATVRNAPGLLGVRVAEADAVNAANLKAELAKFEKLAPLQRKEAIDKEVAKVEALSTPEMLKKTRAIALAGHIVDPSYQLMPQADGTVVAVNARNPKDTKVLQDGDGKPLIRKDPEEMKAAVAVINMANTNLRIAEAAYKVDATSLEPGVKEKATVAWEAAQKEAKQLTAPAYAVLYAKAKIPTAPDAPTSAPAGTPEVGTVVNGKQFKGGDPNKRENWVVVPPSAPAATPGILGTLSPQQQREAELRAQYEADEAKKKLEKDRYQQEFKDNVTRTALRSGI